MNTLHLKNIVPTFKAWRIVALLLLGAIAGLAHADRNVRITNGEWPPYLSANLPDNGLISRVVTEAFRLQGITVEYGFFPWARALLLAKIGGWDGTVAWARSPARERDFYISDPV